jgi:hypothetical protein
LEGQPRRITGSLHVTSEIHADQNKSRLGVTLIGTWHGRFFATDHDYNGGQSYSEIAAAKKAVWLASKVKETLGLSAIKLALKDDAEWLCYANAVRQGKEGGGRARALGDLAIRSGVVLTSNISLAAKIRPINTRYPPDSKNGRTRISPLWSIDAPSACRGAMTLHGLV